MIRAITLCTAVVFALTQVIFGADASPDFTGQWTVNIGKSNFGPLFAPKSAQVKIDQKDQSLAIVDNETNEQEETTRTESHFTIDGKDTAGTIIAFPMELKGVAQWVGTKLSVIGDGKFNGMPVHVDEKWELGEGGTRLTITRKLSAAIGTTIQTVQLEK